MSTKLITNNHRFPYHAISPSAPHNSQHGRTVLITGGSASIGLATAHAFVAAGAACVIVTGRREDVLASAVKELENAKPSGSKTIVLGRKCDVASEAEMLAMWQGLAKNNIAVDILILNGGKLLNCGISSDFAQARQMYQINVIANLQIAESFINQGPQSNKTILFVSSAAAHLTPISGGAAYSATKLATSNMFQNLATEYSAETLNIINVHPGAVFTEGVERHGLTRDLLPWDSVELPAGFLVWASTQHARFLHGRFVHANWDVGELMALEPQLQADQGLLRSGFHGIDAMGQMEFMGILVERGKEAKPA